MPFDERMLNGMGVLTAIVDCGSFAAAGEALDMSQSGAAPGNQPPRYGSPRRSGQVC